MSKQLPDYKEVDLENLRPFAKIRLVALDLDGTLLESKDSDVPKKIAKLARKLKNCSTNVRITIATGRTLEGVHALLDKLEIFNDTPIILYNGSLILIKKTEIINLKTIPQYALERIVKICSKVPVKVIAYVCNWFGSELKEDAFGWSLLDRPEFEHNGMPVKWLDWDTTVDVNRASSIVIHTAGQINIISSLNSELSKIDGVSHTFGGTSYIEIRPIGSNKGTALDYVARNLKLSREEVLALGDNDNDAEMLAWAGIGVTIDSGSPVAVKHSDYITKRGVIEGAIETLNLVHSARRLLGKNDI